MAKGHPWGGWISARMTWGIFLGQLFTATVWAGPGDWIEPRLRVGPGIWALSVEGMGHFLKPDEIEDNFFFRERWLQEPEMRVRKREPSLLSWNLGFGYQHDQSPPRGTDLPIVDNLFSLLTGFRWEALPALEFTGKIFVEAIPEELYGRGAFLLTSEYRISLRPKTKEEREKEAKEIQHLEQIKKNSRFQYTEQLPEPEPKYDPDDAIQYYRVQREKERKRILEQTQEARKIESLQEDDENLPEDPEPPEERIYPSIALRGALGFSHHLVGAKVYRKASLAGISVGEQILNQYQIGGEAIYYPYPEVTLRGGAYAYIYSDIPDRFAVLLEKDPATRVNLVPRSGLSSFDNQSLNFPAFSFDESIDWGSTDDRRYSFSMNQTIYAVTQPTSFSFAPGYQRDIGKDWRMKLEVMISLGGVLSPYLAGAANFTHPL